MKLVNAASSPVVFAYALIFLVGIGALAFFSSRVADFDNMAEKAPRKKVYRKTIAEDVKISQHGIYGVDLVSCKSCRMEKMKKGIFTFGGMNVLVLDELAVVLPPGEMLQGDGTSRKDGARALARHMGMTDGFLASQGMPNRFSGLKINGLSVSRLVDGNRVEKAFEAQNAEAVRGGLKLKGCMVYGDGGNAVRSVSGAMLARTNGKLCLSWDGGKMDLN